jgi:hypothetical protein
MLGGTEGLRAEAARSHLRVETWRGGLHVTTITPGWGVGWRAVFSDDDVYDVLSWLMHYVQQYVHRSLVVGALMALRDERGVVLHPFGLAHNIMRWGPAIPAIPYDEALSIASTEAASWQRGLPVPEQQAGLSDGPAAPSDGTSTVLCSAWLDRNALDPHIHQGAFHMLRGLKLVDASFGMEAAGAFNCVLEVATQFLQCRRLVSSQQGRVAAASFLGVSDEMKEVAETLAFMRNHFAAHAGGWRWWDFHELFGESLTDAATLAGEVLRRMADLEPSHRLVEPTPQRWSEWFWVNFEILWRAVWFEALTTRQPEQS